MIITINYLTRKHLTGSQVERAPVWN